MEYSNRKSPRIPQYDYATSNFYFITICTHNKECIFGKPGRLNTYGRIAEENLKKIPKLFPSVQIEKYVVMPNHIHDHVIRNQKSYEKIWTYIENNPMKWEEDCFFMA